MDRTRSLDRRYRRILCGSLAVSAGVHAALLGLTFDTPLLRTDASLEIEQLREEQPFDAVEVVAVSAARTAAPLDAAAGMPASPADAAPAAPSRSAAASASASAPPVPQPVEAEVTFEELTLFDPLSQAPIRPVLFTDLPEAVVSRPVESALNGEAEDDVQVYVPGSIGAAKRQWSGSTGTNPLGGGDGVRIFGGAGGGGHCPMPGGRHIPPIWR